MNAIKLFAVVFAAIFALLNADFAFARGGAANIMSSPGYQRRLQESRQEYLRANSQPVVVYPARRRHHNWRHRGHR